MSREDYVLLESFVVPEAASVLRARLELAGIPSFIENDTVASTLWHLSNTIGGTRLLVPADRFDEAQQFLAEDRKASAAAWTCDCGATVDAGFDLCWQCGATRSELDAGRSAAPASPPNMAPREEVASPAAVLGVIESASPAGDVAEAAVFRAWRASIIGLGLCPGILHVYSLIVLLPHLNATLSPAGTRRFYGALVVDAVMLLAIVKVFASLGL